LIEDGAKVKDKGWPTQHLPAGLPSEEEVFGDGEWSNKEPDATKCSLKHSSIADLSEIILSSMGRQFIMRFTVVNKIDWIDFQKS